MGPSARVYFGMAWDGIEVAAFSGGFYISTTLYFGNADTWIWDGAAWTPLNPSNPPLTRIGHAMCYDGQGALLFGGYAYNGSNAVFMNDTWRFSSGNWTQLSPTGGPPPARYLHRLCYDSGRNVVVLFGGRSATGNVLNDIWEFNVASSTWTQKNPSGTAPAPRYRYAMAWCDSTIIAGGRDNNGTVYFNDTFGYDGSGWTEYGPTLLGNLSTMAMAAGAGDAVVYGGLSFNGSHTTYRDRTWLWSGSTWTEILQFETRPPPRAMHELVYDAARSEFVLFGGYDGSNCLAELWTLKKQ
jgi:hypothetical protein